MNKIFRNKKFRNILGIVWLITASLATLGATTPTVDAYNPPHKKPQMDITQSMNSDFDSVYKIYSHNKIIPKSLEKQIIYALSYFPELIDAHIEFRIEKTENGIISTRPTIGSVFKSKKNRKYIVFINDTSAQRTIPSFLNGPVNGQVGILGHELCHVIYYNHRTGFGLAGLAIAYSSKNFVDGFENKTDSMDIERGLGFQLIAWGAYLHKKFAELRGNELPPFERKPGRERYMSEASIRRVMAGSKVYQTL